MHIQHVCSQKCKAIDCCYVGHVCSRKINSGVRNCFHNNMGICKMCLDVEQIGKIILELNFMLMQLYQYWSSQTVVSTFRLQNVLPDFSHELNIYLSFSFYCGSVFIFVEVNHLSGKYKLTVLKCRSLNVCSPLDS